jgi:TetR/AcrR family transcriptional regulator, transcriptional repressor for nem operon
VLQGAFILAKVKDSADIAAASVDHLRRYVELSFWLAIPGGKQTP